MAKRLRQHRTPFRAAQAAGLAVIAAAACSAAVAQGPAIASPAATSLSGWQACASTPDSAARLACFDAWARQQDSRPPAPLASTTPPATPAVPPPLAPATTVATINDGCHNPRYSALSRFWELEEATDCGTFEIRGYRPISLSIVGSDGVNRQPTSDNPENNATTSQPYRSVETRLQLSVRTKMAQGLLTRADPARKDSLWFGYTQQSYWQLFNGALSRPFRSTDHEPELIYIYPADASLPGGWRLRYGGLSLVHQSNGQSLPLSRSWNRVVLMAGMEHGSAIQVQARLWRRIPEDPATDDNPRISDYVGRSEVSAFWDVSALDTIGITGRHSLARLNRGSARIEWLRALGPGRLSGLRLHTQLFNGYGDSLLDYNRRRTVLNLGLSLVEW